MARRSKRKEALTVGIAGSGSISIKAAKQHLTRFIESEDTEIFWVLPFSETSTKSVQDIIDFLWEENAQYGLVSDRSLDDEDLTDAASWILDDEVEDVEQAVAEYLISDEIEGEAKFLVLLDEEKNEDHDLVELVYDADVPVLDLLAGIRVVEYTESETADEVADETDDDDDDSTDDVDESEEAPTVTDELPADAAQAIEDGDLDTAIDILKELSKPDLTAVSEKLGLAVEKGKHRKTIATNVVEYVASGLPDEKPAAEEKPKKEKPQKKPRGRRGQRKAEEKAEVQDAPEIDQDQSEEIAKEVVVEGEIAQRVNGTLTQREIIQALTHVAAQQGADEASKFLDVLKTSGFTS